jgi:NADPH:quinone reductase-like Zn-dependent oxidoreductase
MTDTIAQPISGKAVTYSGQGGYEVIGVQERSVRAPGHGEVRIEVKAAAVNPTDILLRTLLAGDGTAPIVPGMDAAGIVESVGPGVVRLHRGQQVMAAVQPRRPEGGAQAHYIVIPAASALPIPQGVSMIEASTLPMNGLTAFGVLALVSERKGETLAVSGGAGLLARYAIAVARRQGLRVIADARPEESDLVRSYGAHVVIERGSGFAAAIRREHPDGVDALLDTALLGEECFDAIREGGLYVPVRGWNGKQAERGIAIEPFFVNAVLERTDWLEQLRDMVAQGEIGLRVTGEYRPEQVADAQRAVAAGGLRGRPVIVFG